MWNDCSYIWNTNSVCEASHAWRKVIRFCKKNYLKNLHNMMPENQNRQWAGHTQHSIYFTELQLIISFRSSWPETRKPLGKHFQGQNSGRKKKYSHVEMCIRKLLKGFMHIDITEMCSAHFSMKFFRFVRWNLVAHHQDSSAKWISKFF